MKLHVASDLHLNLMSAATRNGFWQRFRNQDRSFVDALVLAGDIGGLAFNDRFQLLQDLSSFCELYPRVFYVAGNHEFWGTDIPTGLAGLDYLEEQLSNLTVLESGYDSEINGVSIGGDTLWFPDCGDSDMKRYWADYDYIRDADTDIERAHQKFRRQEFQTLMVSHHFPTSESIAPEFRRADTNCFFSGELNDVLSGAKTRLWIHGHTHNPMDFQSKFGFRVYCNPLGYPNEGRNPDFWSRLSVDFDSNP